MGIYHSCSCFCKRRASLTVLFLLPALAWRWSVHLTPEYRILTEPDIGPDWLFLAEWSEFRRKICRMKNIIFEIRCFSAFPGKIRQIPGLKWACLVLFGWLIAGFTGQYSWIQEETPVLEVSNRDDSPYTLAIKSPESIFLFSKYFSQKK